MRSSEPTESVRPMILNILHYPDERLREPGKKIDEVTPSIKALIEDMAETMYAAPGVGLAATQVGEAYQLFLVDIATDDEPSDLRVFVNPEIVEKHGDTTFEEGCLSFPGAQEEIERAERILVRALDREGRPFELEAEGLLAIAIQHEYDHLQGILMIDRVGPLKKRLLHRKMLKRAERAGSR